MRAGIAALRDEAVRGAPGLAVAVALAAAPVAAVLQEKALAPLALLAMAIAVVAHRRRHGAWPWPRHGGVALGMALALGAWGAASALWAPEPRRALSAGLAFAAMALLAAAAARAVAEGPNHASDAAARRRLACWLVFGLAAGLAAAAFDLASGHVLRAAVRGLREAPPELVFGLKPAASVIAMLLPLVVAARSLPGWMRGALMAAGAAVVMLLPGDSAKLAALAGLAAAGAGWAAPRLAPRVLGVALGLWLLAAPAVMAVLLAPGMRVDALPPSAAHRVLVWDFALARIADRPLLGWGMEASRALPGGDGGPSPATLERFGLTSPAARDWFARPEARLMPLHPHNGALEIRLELGIVGSVLAAALAVGLGFAAARAPSVPAATGALAAAAVTGLLSFGTWQAWWVAAQLLALVAVAGVPAGADAIRSAAPSRAGVAASPSGGMASSAPPPPN